jgi:hypothetical protein
MPGGLHHEPLVHRQRLVGQFAREAFEGRLFAARAASSGQRALARAHVVAGVELARGRHPGRDAPDIDQYHSARLQRARLPDCAAEGS